MDPSASSEKVRRGSPWIGWAVFVGVLAATFVLGILASSILQRRQEAAPPKPLRPIAEWETDSSRWAESFPRQYDRYRRMFDDATRTKYGGAFPRDYLEETPTNVILFAGYGFAKEYRQGRGHVYAVDDVTETARVGAKTPATCWTCKSPDVPRLMATLGVAEFYRQPFAALRDQVRHPIGCRDCHDPQTMKLVITRPALREALLLQGRTLDEISHQEMRSLVCAQCHVEYYFKGAENYLVFPWTEGTTPEAIEAYYEATGFADWTHAVSKTPMVKIQHPDYEVYLTGIHAFRNVSCADCHMPYISEGGAKFTDHHVQSPLLAPENSCLVCHRWSEKELRSRVEAIQDKIRQTRDRAERMLAMAHFDIAAAMEAGADDAELAPLRSLVRGAQLRWDYVAAHNSMGFHSPAECLRILAAAIDLAGQARTEAARALAARRVIQPVRYPQFDTKEKAQALVEQFIAGTPPKLLP